MNRIKKLSLAFLLPVLLVALAGEASAQKPIPGIKKTAEYRSLLSYVNFLQTKKSTPASSSQKQTYRTNLNNRRAKTNNTVKKLYNRRLIRIEKQDDRAERRQIKKVRQQQKRRVAQLNGEKGERIGEAGSTYRARVSQINANYAGRIDSKVNKRRRLRAKLNRTTNPIAREVLLTQIESLGPTIRRLKDARQRQFNQASARYRAKVNGINARFSARIAGTKRFYKSLVRQIKDNWKKTFREDIRAAKSRRDSEFSLVTGLHNRGAGYIDQMPSPPPPPS